MSKSAIYTANTTITSGIISGSTLPLGTTIRRFGCNAQLSGNGILLNGQGYYDVDVAITLAPSALDTLTVQLYKDGVPVPGAVATVTAAAGVMVAAPINALVRLQCCNTSSTLTLGVTAETDGTTITVENLAVVVEKL